MISAENNQLIADVARDIIGQTAPQELPLFRAISVAYFKDPNKLPKQQGGKDEMLGFGVGEVVVFLTPAVLVVVTEVVTFVTTTVKETLVQSGADLISDHVKDLFKTSHPEGKNEAGTPSPLTLQQISRVHQLAYEKFLKLKLPDAQANRLADAVVATLVSEDS